MGKSQFQEVGGGYTFYCIGKPEDNMKISGFGLPICTNLARELESLPRGISDCRMTLRIRTRKDQNAMIISTNPEDAREPLYEEFSNFLTKVSHKDKLFFLVDVNFRVRSDHAIWPNMS